LPEGRGKKKGSPPAISEKKEGGEGGERVGPAVFHWGAGMRGKGRHHAFSQTLGVEGRRISRKPLLSPFLAREGEEQLSCRFF